MTQKVQVEIPAQINQTLSSWLRTENWPELQLPPMDFISFDKEDITSIFDEIKFDGTSAKITALLSQDNHEKFAQYLQKPLGYPCGDTISGRAGDFEIKAFQPSITGHNKKLSFDGKGGGAMNATCTFHAINWEISSSLSKPQTWACEIDKPVEFRPNGNLRFHINDNTLWGYFLQGAYDYYLLPRQQKVIVLIVPRDQAEFSREKFALDVMSLSFVFGEQINIHSIVGLNSDYLPIAEYSGFVKTPPTETGWVAEPFPTIMTDEPELVSTDELWMVPFFKRLSEAVHTRPSVRLDYALDAYLDSLRPHIIASYLRLQVILESFSYWILREKGSAREGLVKSADEWEKWVKKELKAKIHDLALDEYKEDLYLGVKGAYKHVSGRRVQDAFKLHDLGWTDAMKAEIKLRNDVVHMMELSKRRDGKIDAADLMPRLRLLQVLLIALIARVVGYGGMIRHWKAGPRKEAGWWPLDEEQRKEALRLYINSAQT